MSKRGLVLTALFALLVAGSVAGFLRHRRSTHLAATADAYAGLRWCLYGSPLGATEKASDRLVARDLCDRSVADPDTCQAELDSAIRSWGDLGVDTDDSRFGRVVELSRRAYAPDNVSSRWLTGDEHPLIDELEDALAKADLPATARIEVAAPCLAHAKFSTDELAPFDDEVGFFGEPLPSRAGDEALRVDFNETETLGSRLCAFARSGLATVTCGASKAAPRDEPIMTQSLAILVHAKRIEDASYGPGFVVFTDQDGKTFVATRTDGTLGAPIPLAIPAHWMGLRSCPSERGPVIALSSSSVRELRVFYPKDTTSYEEPITIANPFGDGAAYGEEARTEGVAAFACSPSGVPRWAWRDGGTFSTLSCPRSGCARRANPNVSFPPEARPISITPFDEDKVLIAMQASQAGRFADHVVTIRARAGTIDTVSNGADTVLWGRLSNSGSYSDGLQAFAFEGTAWVAFRIDGRLRALRTRSDVNGFEVVRAP